jgi:hypothetical protein
MNKKLPGYKSATSVESGRCGDIKCSHPHIWLRDDSGDYIATAVLTKDIIIDLCYEMGISAADLKKGQN